MTYPPTQGRKRVREACEPCRRKKGRCGGERPVCSLCQRLGQDCSWGPFSRTSNTDNQLDNVSESSVTEIPVAQPRTESNTNLDVNGPAQVLNDKLTEVLDRVRLLTSSQYPVNALRYDTTTERTVYESPTIADVQQAAWLFLRFCQCQPLALYSASTFLSTVASRDLEVRLCVLGLATRFDDVGSLANEASRTRHMEAARSVVIARIADGRVELSTLQCLCMLSLYDFMNGDRQRAMVNLSLATDLCRSARLDVFARKRNIDARAQEYVNTLWSIIMLQYLIGGFGPISTSINVAGLIFPSSDAENTLAASDRQLGSCSEGMIEDFGVVAYQIQMTEAWHHVRKYIHHRGILDANHPPWSEKSEYSKIVFRQMELESQMPPKHRFKPSGFADHDINVLATNRQYWAPWLYLQMIYHTIVCTMNHPILLSLHLRRFRVNSIPELFLQRTADMISTHTDWVIHLLEWAEEKDFEFTDPVIGHCVAIIATIFLQQSYTEDQTIRIDKQQKFKRCLRMVQDLGGRWHYVRCLADDLKSFERTISNAYSATSAGKRTQMSKHVDMSAFWRILDNTSSYTTRGASIFGPSLTFESSRGVEDGLLSTHPLPEPTRVGSLPQSSRSTASTPFPTGQASGTQAPMSGPVNAGTYSSSFIPYVDSPFPAQNFFALGQDFVGNADEWFQWDGS